ncbi:MAG: PH domain-containing protein [Actinobacteria bacterium]|nr:PH domain-containing protein [Actinomycetota bacterium]
MGEQAQNRCSCPASTVSEYEGESLHTDHLTLVHGALRVWQIRGILGGLILVALIVAASWLPFAPELLTSNLAIIFLLCLAPPVLEALFLDPLRHKRYSLRIHRERLVINQGVIFLQKTVIPRSSILNMRLRRGPVLRRMGLTGVSIVTIADHHNIGPFDAAQVEMIEEFMNGTRREPLS